MKKPVLEKDIDLFRISVYPLGFSVEMIGKPKTFKSLCFSSGKNLDDITNLSEESMNRIQKYINDIGADGALVTEKKQRKNLVGGIDLTFIPYRLVTMNYEYYKSKFGEKFESWSKK